MTPGVCHRQGQPAQRVGNAQRLSVPAEEEHGGFQVAQGTGPHLRDGGEREVRPGAPPGIPYRPPQAAHPAPPRHPARTLTRGVQEKWSTLSGSASCSKSKLPVPTLLEDVGQGHRSPVRVRAGDTGASELKGLGSILSRSPKVSGVSLSKREELGKSASQIGGC